MKTAEMDRDTANNLQLKQAPAAKTGMLIRRPVADVFAAFIDPDLTTRFWFTKSSGRLETGKQIKWEWEMYGASTQVAVKAIEPNKRILIDWDGYSGRTTVEWKFAPQKNGTTFVSITESGWTGDADDLLNGFRAHSELSLKNVGIPGFRQPGQRCHHKPERQVNRGPIPDGVENSVEKRADNARQQRAGKQLQP